MRKIGILTFHRAYNYGATLQAYALLAKLRAAAPGADVRIVDYRSASLESAAGLVKPGDGLSPRTAAKVAFRILKHRGFDAFDRERMAFTETLRAPGDIAGAFSAGDAVVVGSDQVWNDGITGSDPAFYLDVPGLGAQRYSYAASFAGSEEAAARVLGGHLEQLGRFREVSLREPGGMGAFRAGLPCGVRQDVDPVLLLDRAEWGALARGRRPRQPYLFMYLVGPELRIRRFAESYACARGLKLVDNKTSPEFLLRCAPWDFLSWIEGADCVVTNSFHGTAFSILFHKNAYYELGQGEGRNFRAASLLEAAGVTGREIAGDEAPEEDAPVDWSAADERLAALRADSLAYVRRIALGE